MNELTSEEAQPPVKTLSDNVYPSFFDQIEDDEEDQHRTYSINDYIKRVRTKEAEQQHLTPPPVNLAIRPNTQEYTASRAFAVKEESDQTEVASRPPPIPPKSPAQSHLGIGAKRQFSLQKNGGEPPHSFVDNVHSIDYEFVDPSRPESRPQQTGVSRNEHTAQWALATSDLPICSPLIDTIPFNTRPVSKMSRKSRKPKINADKFTIDYNLFPTAASSTMSSGFKNAFSRLRTADLESVARSKAYSRQRSRQN